jgi:hypothetical protein
MYKITFGICKTVPRKRMKSYALRRSRNSGENHGVKCVASVNFVPRTCAMLPESMEPKPKVLKETDQLVCIKIVTVNCPQDIINLLEIINFNFMSDIKFIYLYCIKLPRMVLLHCWRGSNVSWHWCLASAFSKC